MKIIFITCLLTLTAFLVKSQNFDTLKVLKEKALVYTHQKLLKPKTYKSLGWSQIWTTQDGYRIINVFSAENHSGKISKLAYTFNFDKQFYLVYVNTDPIEKQIRDAKTEIKQATETEKRIIDTRDRQIEALKNKQ
jgi:hypothetical protein